MNKKVSLIICFLLVSFLTFAQPTDPSADPDNPVPLGGIELLLGAGALLGIKYLRKKNRK
ncbi:MAG: hypothetical protein AB7K37_14720 [Cyclobacteriaceae bacterium]